VLGIQNKITFVYTHISYIYSLMRDVASFFGPKSILMKLIRCLCVRVYIYMCIYMFICVCVSESVRVCGFVFEKRFEIDSHLNE